MLGMLFVAVTATFLTLVCGIVAGIESGKDRSMGLAFTRFFYRLTVILLLWAIAIHLKVF